LTQPDAVVSGPLRRLGASLLALGRIRLELLAIEVQEEKERVAALLLWSVLTALLIGVGAVFAALFVTVALWDTHRLAALGVSALLFVGGGLYGLSCIRRLASAPSTLFEASIAELREDSAALRRPPAP
jgi:uncharacterized membrane protein YqjE